MRDSMKAKDMSKMMSSDPKRMMGGPKKSNSKKKARQQALALAYNKQKGGY